VKKLATAECKHNLSWESYLAFIKYNALLPLKFYVGKKDLAGKNFVVVLTIVLLRLDYDLSLNLLKIF